MHARTKSSCWSQDNDAMKPWVMIQPPPVLEANNVCISYVGVLGCYTG